MRFFPWNNTDPDAAAYIAAVVAAGATVTATQSSAIDSFIKAEKAASRWTLHSRIYLPIWAGAAANAIDIVTRASGTFVGGVTHASGYVQGNGTTGYFNTNVTPSTIGQTLASASLTALVTQAPSGTGAAVMVGSIDGSDTNKMLEISHQSAQIFLRACTATFGSGQVAGTLARASQVGVLIGSREGGNRRIIHRITSGVSTLIDTAGADFGTIPVTGTLQCMRSSFGTGSAYSDARYGFFAAGAAQTVAQAQGFSSNIKTLWETATGSTLP